ncbi:hypothetical protein COEREDRAFT_84215 [Coemansia reversa NRRL 1564]|uniref:DSBA-like thioredoxin domain-containing protein n=1 Tax=Coemansia reversa (strain ATCC 12441 / NRRL 1564) TaxID=763665 RepID=A0A2G5BKP6_COERN|nr:hypothetical protein COEREDRAFT_84215 [Coemansia reversa NRRL 1564]|eukprot:PIA19579.1 hypothetical protein COEREDRAFT_84215 [Coemansia reversa NRRL 1564]
MGTLARVDFWFEYASPYSMLSALRLLRSFKDKTHPNSEILQGLSSCQLPNLEKVHIVYRPIFVGPVFKAAGQQIMPNIQVPAKAKYLFHDVCRSLDLLGCQGFPASRPSNWPPNTILPGRVTWMLAQGFDYVRALDHGNDAPQKSSSSTHLSPAQTRVLAEFVWQIFEAEFIAGKDIGSPVVVSQIWDTCVAGPMAEEMDGALPDGKQAVALASKEVVKEGFRSSTQAAIDASLFGVPSFTTEDGDMYWGNDRLIDAVTHHKYRKLLTQSAGFSAKAKAGSPSI